MKKPVLNLEGIITVLNTPFTEEDTIDTESLRKNVNIALQAGIAGILVPAMASEAQKLTEAERLLMVKTVVDEVKGRTPIIGGATAPSGEERVKYAQQLMDIGCDGILVSIPYTNDAQYESDVWVIAELNPGFLMLQDWDFNGFGIPVPLIVKLFREIDVFRSIKVEVAAAGKKYSDILTATEGRLHVAGGWAVNQFIEALDRGVHAFMPTGLHEIYVKIFDLYKSGDREGAKDLFNRILPVVAFSNQNLDISIHFFKRLLHAQAIYATPRVREPILPFDGHHEKIAQEHISEVKRLIHEIK